jgi:dihydroorotase
MKSHILIKNGRVIDPSINKDELCDILIEDGIIKQLGPKLIAPNNSTIINAANKIVCPGFIDVHCHLREPGEEHKETIATGTKAAAAGGFTTVCTMPNTIPPTDNRSVVELIKNTAVKEGVIRVLPIACVTAGSLGNTLTEMYDLATAGVIGFSDDGNPVENSNIMRQALNYSADLNLPIINHCETKELSQGTVMNEGWVATQLGLRGMPNASEETMVARDIALAQLTGGHVHIAHVSTAGSLELIRQAKLKNINVTCEVTPHHLTLSDILIMGSNKTLNEFSITNSAYNTNAKVNPPLRSNADMEEMVNGLNDGTIDMIATDHAPHSAPDKICTFNEAAFGISVLETALASALTLVHEKKSDINTIINKLTFSPAKFLNSDFGTLQKGRSADITIFDLDKKWLVEPSRFISKGKNSPLNGTYLKGKVETTIFRGKIIYP